MSETALEGFLSQLPLSRSLVVGFVNLMPMALKQKGTIRAANMCWKQLYYQLLMFMIFKCYHDEQYDVKQSQLYTSH